MGISLNYADAIANSRLYICGMYSKLTGWSDTIVALATAQGPAAIGVIRLSGDEAITIVNKLFTSKDLAVQPSHTLHVGWLKHEGQVLDEVVVALYKNPKSYTGEDVVEISCHGSAYIQQQILNTCCQLGARPAKAGEFTQRAFLKGKLDLTQAEAVADIIASNTAASRNTALHNIRGGFSNVLKTLREQLIQFSALIELELDFATEDVEFADRSKFYTLVQYATETVAGLLQSFQLGNVIKNGVSVAIIGKPNAGKSTLLNALLNEERAIVSEIAGTTRDTIEEVINIHGILFRLIDTAGIRKSKGDIIEDIGIEKGKANAAKADIIIHLIDLTDPKSDDMHWLDVHADKVIEVRNKFDAWYEQLNKEGIVVDLAAGIYISAKEKDGIDAVKSALFEKVASEDMSLSEGTIVTNTRHVAVLKEIQDSLHDIRTGLDANIPGDLLAIDIRRCLHYLGEITGEITNEDRLDYIFSKFCIGK
jgi:tRNA modification GTPase